MSEALRKRLSFKFYLIAIISFLILLDGITLWLAINFDHDRTVERTETILQKTAISLDERVKRTYLASEAILRNLAQRIQEKGIEKFITSKEEWERFRSLADTLPDEGSLWLLDSKANLLIDSTSYPSKPMNFAEREYYIPQRDRGIETYIGPIVKGKITNKYSFTISQRINGKDGQFLGIVVAAIETDAFTNFLRILDIGEGSRVTVFRTDGALIFRQPMQDELLGRNFKHLPLFSIATDESPSGIFESDQIDGVKRLVAYRKIEGLPLYVTTTIPVDSFLKELHTRVKYYSLIAAIIFLILAGLSMMAYRAISREELVHRELILAGERISKINEELDMRVRERTADFEAANKDLEAFAYTVSHDLRAPLRAIDGFTEMLLKDIGMILDPESKRKFQVIKDNSKKMGQLIDDILNFSRTGRNFFPSSGVLDIQLLVEDVWKELQAGNPDRDMELRMSSLPPAAGDRTLLRQVLANILGNAVKFTRGRKLAVIEVSGSNEGDFSTYCIRDNGAGFDMRYYDKLFEIFRRMHSSRDFEGTGVGLAIVKKIIDKHGGRIWAESKVGEGATFYFTLPSDGR